MIACPNCADLQAQIDELNRRIGIYTMALGEIKFSASDALHQTSISAKSIDVLELTVRSGNILRAEGIVTVGDLVRYGAKRLSHSKGMGRRSMAEIHEALAQYRLSMQP